jgi:hypothetical protein
VTTGQRTSDTVPATRSTKALDDPAGGVLERKNMSEDENIPSKKTVKLAIEALEKESRSLAPSANLYERFALASGEMAYKRRRAIWAAIKELKVLL